MSHSVGIILPVYNAKETVGRAINSVLNQSYSNWILYIIDDCSSDDSYTMIKDTYKDSRIVYYRNKKNLGAAESRNAGIRACKEDILCFIDSDDEWHSCKLDLQVKEILGGEKLVFTDYYYVNDVNDKYTVSERAGYLTKNDFLKKKFRVCFSSVCLVKKENIFFKNIGHEDFDYLFKYFSIYTKAKVINKELVFYYESKNSLSSNKLKSAKWHYSILGDVFKSNILRFYYFSWYIYKAFQFRRKVKGKV